MSIIPSLTLKSMKKNKTTTIATIIGIIMSIALMTGLFLFSNGLLQFLRDDYAYRSGDSEIIIPEIRQSEFDQMPQQELVDQQTRLALLGVVPDPEVLNWPTIVMGFDPENSSGIAIHLVDGRLPQKSGEALMTRQALVARDAQLGDTVSLVMYQPEKFIEVYRMEDDFSGEGQALELEVVGMIEYSPISFPLSGPAILLYQTSEEISQASTIWTGFTLKELNDESIEQFAQSPYEINVTALAEYSPGVSSKAKFYIQTFATVLLIIVALAGIGLIQNGFMISLSQRMKELSILSSVGMTRRQKWRMTMTEGLILYMIALPIGLLSGFVAMMILFQVLTPLVQRWISGVVELRMVWDGQMIGLIALAGLVTVFIATIIPAIRTSQSTPLVGVRQQEDFVLKPKSLRTPVVVQKLFGLEGEIAWKNLKRNKRRYRGTLVSLVLSLVLYLSLASLMHYTSMSTDVQLSRGKEDIVIGYNDSDLFEHQAYFESLLQEEGVKDGFVVYSFYGYSNDLTDYDMDRALGDRMGMAFSVLSFDSTTLDGFLKDWGLTREDLRGDKAVLVNQFRTQDENMNYVTKRVFENIPDVARFEVFDPEESIQVELEVIKGLPEALVLYNTWNEEVVLVVLPETLESILSQMSQSGSSVQVRLNTVDAQHNELVEELQSSLDNQGMTAYLTDQHEQYQREHDFITIAKILFFGFATIIALISLANIYNSLISSLRFRRKEFAMLRSVGMEEKSFRKMIRFESYFYALKLLLYGIPLGIGSSYLIYRFLIRRVQFGFKIPVLHFSLAALTVVLVLVIIMNLGSHDVRKGNILDSLKMEMDL